MEGEGKMPQGAYLVVVDDHPLVVVGAGVILGKGLRPVLASSCHTVGNNYADPIGDCFRRDVLEEGLEDQQLNERSEECSVVEGAKRRAIPC